MRLALCFVLALAAGSVGLRSAMPAPTGTESAPPALRAQDGPRPAANAPLRQASGTDGSSPVPEPSTLLLVGTGLVSVALTARFRRRRPR